MFVLMHIHVSISCSLWCIILR